MCPHIIKDTFGVLCWLDKLPPLFHGPKNVYTTKTKHGIYCNF